MSTTLMTGRPADPSTSARGERVGWLAALCSGAAGLVALWWTLRGHGYPLGTNEPDNEATLLRFVPVDVGAPLLAALLLSAAVLCLAMTGAHRIRVPGAARSVVLGYGWTASAVLLLVVPDATVLMLTGYAPMLVLGAPFGWPPVDYSNLVTAALLIKLACVVGGLLLAVTLARWARRTRGACASCGRGAQDVEGVRTRPWARWAVGVAVAVPLVYASTRFAWLLGIPLAIGASDLRELRDSGAVWAGAGLATFAVAGAVLTLGLVQRWGEVFPRWFPVIGGRRVPVPLAVVPAVYVAAIITAGGLALAASPMGWRLVSQGNPLIVPHLLWPFWGAALGAATYAYALRRRGACHSCGREG